MSGLPKETITVKNFGGMTDVTIDLAPINIFIGPQGTGKSVCAKLIYFCRTCLQHAAIGALKSAEDRKARLYNINHGVLESFFEHFPLDAWPNNGEEISYRHELFQMSFTRGDGRIIGFNLRGLAIDQILDAAETLAPNVSDSLPAPDKFRSQLLLNLLSSSYVWNWLPLQRSLTHVYVPAERAVFAAVRDQTFSFLQQGAKFSDAVTEWGALYEFARGMASKVSTRDRSLLLENEINSALLSIVGASYKFVDGDVFLVHEDGREVRLDIASSGQQCALPLWIMLLASLKWADAAPKDAQGSLIIEEPEAHLFPTAQRSLVEVLARIFNGLNGNLQLIITTHSPYILGVFNNLLYAGRQEASLGNGGSEAVRKIVPPELILKPGVLSAFHFEGGTVRSLMNPETGLIVAEELDRVGEELSIQFGDLVEID